MEYMLQHVSFLFYTALTNDEAELQKKERNVLDFEVQISCAVSKGGFWSLNAFM